MGQDCDLHCGRKIRRQTFSVNSVWERRSSRLLCGFNPRTRLLTILQKTVSRALPINYDRKRENMVLIYDKTFGLFFTDVVVVVPAVIVLSSSSGFAIQPPYCCCFRLAWRETKEWQWQNMRPNRSSSVCYCGWSFVCSWRNHLCGSTRWMLALGVYLNLITTYSRRWIRLKIQILLGSGEPFHNFAAQRARFPPSKQTHNLHN